MSAPIVQPAPPKTGPWKRPEPTALGPNRRFGGYYRSADREIDGQLFRGVPLQTAEDAVVAAVRMGYRIADAQIERGMRIARDLNDAAKRTGSGDPNQAIDDTERLLAKAVLAGLQWVEEAASAPGHPVRRLLAAEYRMVGSMFGLGPDEKGRDEKRREAGAVEPRAPGSAMKARPVLRHLAPEQERRPVKAVLRFELTEELPARAPDLLFRPTASDDAGARTMAGRVERNSEGRAVIYVEATADHGAGVWCAGIYDASGEQIGLVELEF